MNTIQLEKPFCVIGLAVAANPLSTRGPGRSWFTDVATAEAHAVELLRRNQRGESAYGNPAADLYVVQAVRVVRTPINYESLAVVRA